MDLSLEGLPSGEFYLLSTSRNPDQFVTVHPKIFLGYLLDFFVRPNLSRISFGSFRPPQIFLGYLLDLFVRPTSFHDILDNMIFLPNSAKPTFIYLSLSVGINLVLLLSSDPLTVIVGFSCLVLSLSSLASFYLDQIMHDQESI